MSDRESSLSPGASRQVRRRRRLQQRAAAGPSQLPGVPFPEVDVGGNLRRLRAERAFSLRALAEKSGLAVNTLSLIENSKTSPSVSTLQQLALALQVPITSFFGMDAPELRVAFIKSDGRPRALFAHGTLEDLGAGLRYRPIEPLVVTLQPAADSGPHPIVHTGFEFVYCLAGRVQYAIDDHEYLLEPGDSLMFQAHLPHRWHNPGPAVAQAILVLSPSDEWDRPVDRHFLPPVGDGQIEGERLSSPSDAHRRTE